MYSRGLDVEELLCHPGLDIEAFLVSRLELGMFYPDSGLSQAALGLEVDVLYRGCLLCSPANRTMHL